MTLARNTVLMMVLLTIVWASLLLATSAIAYILFPVIEYAEGGLIQSLMRVIAGVAVFAIWVYGWYALTKAWFYRLMIRRRPPGQRI